MTICVFGVLIGSLLGLDSASAADPLGAPTGQRKERVTKPGSTDTAYANTVVSVAPSPVECTVKETVRSKRRFAFDAPQTAGKFVTPLGFEVIETKEDWNYSRGLLFTYAVPFYHMGLRAKYAFNDTYSLTGYLVNGWDNVVDDNTGKTYGLSFAWTPNQKFTLSQNYMTGPEQPDSNHGWRSLSDTVISYSPTPRLSLALNYDYGSGDREPASGRPVVWTGVASYIRYAFNERYALATRYEYFDDVDGFRTGTAQHVNEFTTTFERRLARDLIVRLEFRRDVANEPSFLKGDLPVKTQNTLMGGLTYVFDAPESHYEARLTGGAATVTPASSVLRATALSAWRRDVMFICLLSPSALAGELANSKGA
jgi:hypothetical protein